MYLDVSNENNRKHHGWLMAPTVSLLPCMRFSFRFFLCIISHVQHCQTLYTTLCRTDLLPGLWQIRLLLQL